MRRNILKFESLRPDFPDVIVPTRKNIPQWYKDADLWVDNQIGIDNHGLKACSPFLDALTIGYTFVTTDDILVTMDPLGAPIIRWRNGGTMLINDRDPDSAKTLPIPPGCNPLHFTWKPQGVIEIPKGYSAIFTQPFNRTDLPFVTLTGVVDSITLASGAVPFFLKEGFTGIIPQGTPFIQIIPFKREDWKAENVKGLIEKAELLTKKSRSLLKGWYKQNVWEKKNYQ
jgi:hypothetical protein